MIPSSHWFVLVSAVGPATPGWSETLLLAASTGVLGMGLSDIAGGLTDRLSGGDDADDDEGDDDLGDDDAFGDDLGDDDLGDWDDDGDGDGWDDDGEGLDDFGGGGGGSDLEPRLDDLENEVASISSTVGTVRSENEAINETVEDIEDNIRKLLEIYEMVTRGVNPFVDDAPGGGGGGGMGGSFGLFDDADEEGEIDDIDPDIADADADSFFDEDFDDGGFEDDFDDDDFAEDDFDAGDDESAATMEDGGTSGSSDSGGDGGGEGKTFDELKSEYESGGAEWDGDLDADDEADESNADSGPSSEEAATGDAETSESDGGVGDLDVDESASGGMEFGTEPAAADPEPAVETDAPATDAPSETTDVEDDGGTSAPADGSDGKPYLESIPGGFGSELLVIEWLTYLRGRSSTSEALRAIKYYETIGWIGAAAAESLQRYLSGLAGDEVETPAPGGTQLTIEHHTNSLQYIGKLGGTHVDVQRLEWSGPVGEGGRVERRGQHGIQR